MAYSCTTHSQACLLVVHCLLGALHLSYRGGDHVRFGKKKMQETLNWLPVFAGTQFDVIQHGATLANYVREQSDRGYF